MQPLKHHIIYSGFVLTLCLWLSACLSSCQKEIELDLPEYESKMVIEGSIELGEPAMVILSKSISYFENIDLNYLMNNVFIRDAEVYVTASTGETELLTFKYFEDSPIYFAYFVNNIKEKENTSYTLTVKYNDKTYTAETTIPHTFDLDSLWFSVVSEFINADTMRTIRVQLTDNPAEDNYYAFSLKVSCPKFKDRLWVSTLPIAFDDKTFNGITFNYELERYGVSSMFNFLQSQEETDAQRRLTFRPGDTVYVKHSLMDYNTYRFMMTGGSEAVMGTNPFTNPAPVISNIQGDNVLGAWCGFASKTDILIWPDTIGYLDGTYALTHASK